MSLDELSDRVQEPTMPSAIKAGLILAVVSILFSVILYFTGNATNNSMAMFSIPLIFFVVYYFQKKFRDEKQNGYITYGKAFGFGVLMCVVSSAISGIYTYILYSADPSLKEDILEQSYNDMIAQGMPAGQIEQAIEITETFLTPGMMVFWALVAGLIMGAVISLITSAIVKRNHPLD